MPGNSSWMPYAAQGVKGFDDDDDDDDDDDKHMLEYTKQMGFALMFPIKLSAHSI